jgi:cytochrome c oxidase assembly factor 5
MPRSSMWTNSASIHAHRPQVEKRDYKECVSQHAPECESLRYALFHCRRGQMDARTRIQGNKVRLPVRQLKLLPAHV